MNRFRLPASPAFIARPRLLERLPAQRGGLAWLEAPYGYGKSVLASQWSFSLEATGWRVVWVAMLDEPMRETMAAALALPDQAPWALVLEALWSTPTLLVVEDLSGDETLGPLVKSNQGLIVLSSRGPLSDPELVRRRTAPGWVRLTAADLAFTPDEAAQLLGDERRARQAWATSQGWPLLLHLAQLTGEAPEPAALVRGIRESLAPALWDEALFLSALPDLPEEAALPVTQSLAEAGFAQRLSGGYRIHPMAADALRQACSEAVREAVVAQGHRLDWLARGRAYEAQRLGEPLRELLESRNDLGQQAPKEVLRWDAIAPPPRGTARLTNVGLAHCVLRDVDVGIARLLDVARDPAAAPNDALIAYKTVVWELAPHDPQRARDVVAQARPVFERADRDTQARFLNDASRIDYEHGEFDAAQALVARALALLPPDSPRRFPFQINLGLLRWNSVGDLEGYLALTTEALAQAPDLFRRYVGRAHYDLAQNSLMLSRRDAALHHFQRAVDTSEDYPWVRLGAQAMLALLQGRASEVAERVGQLSRWEFSEIEYLVRALWAHQLLEAGDVAAAGRALSGMSPAARDDSGSEMAWFGAVALVRAASGDPEGARAEFAAHARPTARPPLLHWLATHYRLHRDAESLQALIDQSTSGEAMLPAYVPLADLPRDRPALARAYPLEAVLASGWRAAVQSREAEIPDLQVRLLGEWSVTLLGRAIRLGARPRQILALMALRWSRPAIAQALWPEADAEAARNNLNVNLSQLRRQLEPWGVPVFLHEEGLRRAQVDVDEVERALQAGDADGIVAAYRGELLEDLDLPALAPRREALRRQVIAALRAAADRADGARAERWLEAALAIDPCDEAVCRQLLACLVAQGLRARAQSRYAAFARRVQEELGLEPSPELRGFLGRIVADDHQGRTDPV